MDTQRIGAIVIGAIMLFSVAGFASSSFNYTGEATNHQQPEYTISTIVDRLLTGQEKAIILQQGRLVIESVYNEDCEECKLKDGELERFANSYSGFIILESVETDYGEGWELFQMITSNGQIISLEEEEITQENLVTLFCANSVVKPKECLLKQFADDQESQSAADAMDIV